MASIMSFGAGSGLSSCASLDTVSKKEPIIVPSVKELTIPSNYISHCIDEKDYCISVPDDWLILDREKTLDSFNKTRESDSLTVPDYMKEFMEKHEAPGDFFAVGNYKGDPLLVVSMEEKADVVLPLELIVPVFKKMYEDIPEITIDNLDPNYKIREMKALRIELSSETPPYKGQTISKILQVITVTDKSMYIIQGMTPAKNWENKEKILDNIVNSLDIKK